MRPVTSALSCRRYEMNIRSFTGAAAALGAGGAGSGRGASAGRTSGLAEADVRCGGGSTTAAGDSALNVGAPGLASQSVLCLISHHAPPIKGAMINIRRKV